MLSTEEIDWLNGYHARVCATLSPLLDSATAAWLTAATQPLRPR
jgi:Xaa-Pro aminopeptidase